MCVFKGCVAGHGSILEGKRECAGKVGRKTRKPSGSYVVNFWLGVWCVYVCVCVCMCIRGIWQFSPSRIGIM